MEGDDLDSLLELLESGASKRRVWRSLCVVFSCVDEGCDRMREENDTH